MRRMLTVAACLVLSGCASAPLLQLAEEANFGEEPTVDDAQGQIRAFLEAVVNDPESLRLTSLIGPQKGWSATSKDAVFQDYRFGWVFRAEVHGGNRRPDDPGATRYKFFFNSAGALSHVVDLETCKHAWDRIGLVRRSAGTARQDEI